MIQDKIFLDEKDPTGLSYNTPFTVYGSYQGRLWSKTPSGSIQYYSQNSDLSAYATTGSNQFNGSQTITGSLTVTGGISGSSAESASYALNADKIDNLDSTQLVLTSSFNSYTSSASSSVGSLSSSVATTTSGLGGRITTIEGNYATTGSNIFVGSQVITGSICSNGNIVTTGQIVAQTINVQQVTSSIVYSCGSNVFGTDINNTQTFTGSMFITGSNIRANVGNTCFQGTVCAPTFVAGTVSGTTIYGSTAICGGVICGGATTLTGALSGTSATFNHNDAPTIRVQRNGGTDSNTVIEFTNTSRNFYIGSNGTVMGLGGTSGAIGSQPLQISSTGAAIFTCTVTTSNASVSSTYGSLTVGGTGLTIADDGNAKLQIGRYSSTACNAYIKMGTNACSLRFTNNTDLADIVVIEKGGNVGIGNTSIPFGLTVYRPSTGQGDTSTNLLLFDTTAYGTGVGGGISFGGYYNNTNSEIYTYGYVKGGKENSTNDNFAGYVSFGTRASASGSSAERVRINSDGTFLVGATNADVGGSVKGTIIRQDGSIVSARNISSPIHYQSPIAADRMNTMGDGVMYGMWRQGIFQAGIGATNASVMTFFTGNNDSMTERMRISAGTVEVRAAGELRVYRSDNARYGTFYTDNTAVHIGASVDPVRISSPERLEIYTASTERVRITSNGNLKLNGTTLSAFTSNPGNVGSGGTTTLVISQLSGQFQSTYLVTINGLYTSGGVNQNGYGTALINFFTDGSVAQANATSLQGNGWGISASATTGGTFTITFTNSASTTMGNIAIRAVKLNMTGGD